MPLAPYYEAEFTDPDATIATVVGVPTFAVTAFKTGVPHWTLEQPGALKAVCAYFGADLQTARAAHAKAKTVATGRRGHSGAFAHDFGHVWPNLRD